jgi:hypothetical protein
MIRSEPKTLVHAGPKDSAPISTVHVGQAFVRQEMSTGAIIIGVVFVVAGIMLLVTLNRLVH